MKRRYGIRVINIYEVEVEHDPSEFDPPHNIPRVDRLARAFIDGDSRLLSDGWEGMNTKGDPEFRRLFGFDIVDSCQVEELVEGDTWFGEWGEEVKE